MIVQISYKGLQKTPGVEATVQQHLTKLERRLQLFRPELVSLHGSVLQHSPRAGFIVALNLKMPAGDLAAEQASPHAAMAVKGAFDALIAQVTSYKDVLRNHHRFPGRRHGQPRRPLSEIPFEKSLAAVRLDDVTNEDVSSYINANLPRLRHFVRREIRLRESEERIGRGEVSVDDVIGEAIGNALSDSHERPEKMRLEPWLYSLAVDAIEHLANSDSGRGNVPLEHPQDPEYEGDDQNAVEFVNNEDDLSILRPMSHVASPEDLAAKDEMITLIERILRDAGPRELESFILFTVEGFTIEEIADITHLPEEEVRRSVHSARAYLSEALPVRDSLSDRLIEYSKTA